MAGKTIEELRAELEAKRAANLKQEATQTDESAELQREIAIEDKRFRSWSSSLRFTGFCRPRFSRFA